MIKFNQTKSKITVVITAVFLISALILSPSIGDKSYASPPPPHKIIKFTVKNVFEAGSKIDVKLKDGTTHSATVPGKSGTQHVDLGIGRFISIHKGETYTVCLSAPGHGKKCFNEHFTSVPVDHKTVDMNVLRHK